MRINDKLISLPPYISTSWEHVRSLQVEMPADPESTPSLIITLFDNQRVAIPNLNATIIESIFAIHAKVMEYTNEEERVSLPPQLIPPASFPSSAGGLASSDFPVRFGIGNAEGASMLLQHNPAHADAPSLPKEVLRKISAITRILGIDHESSLPAFESDCNCFHCQIARCIHRELHPTELDELEEVDVEDLQFCNWSVEALGNHLYSVINRLDREDIYSVYLGQPLACTCGCKNCEHMRAVLESDAGMD